MTQERLQALKERPHDFWRNSDPMCPHCGHRCGISDNDWWGIFTHDGDVHEKDCPSCGFSFNIKVNTSFTFTTEEQDEDEQP